MAGERLPARFLLRSQLWFRGDKKVLRNRHKPYANRCALIQTPS